MQSESTASFHIHLCKQFTSIVWSCLDSELLRSAVFYAERYYAMDRSNHDARHLYATALLHEGQTYSAMNLVNNARDSLCSGCLEIKAKCLAALGMHREAREALEQTLQDAGYTPTASMGPRIARHFPDKAVMHCRSGKMALKDNLPEQALHNFLEALGSNPFIWEAFEGLCALGLVPPIDEIFPPRPPPIKRNPPEDAPNKITSSATGAGFFTPDTGNSGNLFRNTRGDANPPQVTHTHTSDSRGYLTVNDSHHPMDNMTQNVRPSRYQAYMQPTQISRPLSSADEAGPVHKKLRSTIRQRGLESTAKPTKPTKSSTEDPLKKPVVPSKPSIGVGRSTTQASNPLLVMRRSTRLQSGAVPKQAPAGKHPPSRERRRQVHNTRSHSVESEADEDAIQAADVDYSPSPPANARSPRSEETPSSMWTAADERAAQELYEQELADKHVYDLTRRFASATRALSMYDCKKCLDELDSPEMSYADQQSAWVLAMVGKAHYERLEYAAAERAFLAVRRMEPYRLWDMEIYSTLLWHLQRSVQLSFLAQELLNINPQSPQAWIAVGNLFSLQKERSQALTCFRRAVQLDPTCAYAYTLSGHESIDEDLDKAINFFQTALRADARHYNAWYGLGTCYLRMGKVRLAEYHFRKAADINPNNAVLLGCVGLAVEQRGDQQAALELFNKAVRISPDDNALVRYRRAKIFIAMKKYRRAIEDLEALRNSSPEESNVVFQLARVYRLVGDEVKSAQLLAVARDLSPKSLSKIKKLLETVKDEDADELMDEG